MTLSEILTNSQFSTDESIEAMNSVNTANKALAIINTECGTVFPKMENVTSTYTAMPSSWLFALLSPYISYTIKMNDSSITEADRYLDEFYRALGNFKDKLGTLVTDYDGTDPESGISSDYLKETGFGGVYQIDTSSAINVGWFGDNGNGGSW